MLMESAKKCSPAPFPLRTRAIVLGSFPPRQCGIATFTKDVVDSMSERIDVTCAVVAIDEPGGERRNYEAPVMARLRRDDPSSYADIADAINADSAQVLLVQHEYGLFAGQDGEAILRLLARVRKPVVITMHTVLSRPTPHHRNVAIRLGQRAEAVVVLSRTGKQILMQTYGIDGSKVHVIPHGVPDVPFQATGAAKKALALKGRTVLSTFGLLSRGKGIQYAIAAVPEIVVRYPEVLYLVLGQTHPGVRANEGESYRESLESLVVSLGIQRNVMFVDRYMGFDDLLRFLAATDVYLTPSLDADQIVSGTLAYAVGCGKAVVSTPYLYAREMLAQERGVLCCFADPQSIASSVVGLLDDSERRHAMERRAYRYGRQMTWPHVARTYARLVQEVIPATHPATGRAFDDRRHPARMHALSNS